MTSRNRPLLHWESRTMACWLRTAMWEARAPGASSSQWWWRWLCAGLVHRPPGRRLGDAYTLTSVVNACCVFIPVVPFCPASGLTTSHSAHARSLHSTDREEKIGRRRRTASKRLQCPTDAGHDHLCRGHRPPARAATIRTRRFCSTVVGLELAACQLRARLALAARLPSIEIPHSTTVVEQCVHVHAAGRRGRAHTTLVPDILQSRQYSGQQPGPAG